MTSEEATQKLKEDVYEIRDLLDSYRLDRDIPGGRFAELISMVAQEYRLIEQYLIDIVE